MISSFFLNSNGVYNTQGRYMFSIERQVFSYEYCKIFKNNFFVEHLRWLLLETAFIPFHATGLKGDVFRDYKKRPVAKKMD